MDQIFGNFKSMTYSSLSEDEIKDLRKEGEKNSLEGAVLVHGFESNLSHNQRKKAFVVLNEVLKSGSIVSPSKRELNNSEIERFKDASFDINRVCFEARIGDKDDGCASDYIGAFCFIAPTTILAGTTATEDFAFDNRAIGVWKKDGVQIPLETGLLIIKESLFNRCSTSIAEHARIVGMDENQYLKKYVRIIPDSFDFNDNTEFWNLIRANVQPSSGVTYSPPTIGELNRFVDEKERLNYISSLPHAELSQLGTGFIKDTGFVTEEYEEYIKNECADYINKCSQHIQLLLKDNSVLSDLPRDGLQRIEQFQKILKVDSNKESLKKYLENIYKIYHATFDYDQKRLEKIYVNQQKPKNRREKTIDYDSNGYYHIFDSFDL